MRKSHKAREGPTVVELDEIPRHCGWSCGGKAVARGLAGASRMMRTRGKDIIGGEKEGLRHVEDA